MRILQLCNRIPYPTRDGGALAMRAMSEGFNRAGISVDFLALNTNKHYINPNDLPADFLSNLGKFQSVDINTDVTVPSALGNLFTSESYNIQRFYSADFVRSLHKMLSETKYDIVQFEGLHIAQYVDEARRSSPMSKMILRAHNIEYLIWERLSAAEGNPIKRVWLSLLTRRMKRFETQCLRKMDAITAITAYDRDWMQHQLGCSCPIFVSPMGINADEYLPAQAPELPFSIFHLGSMDWLPNQQGMEWFLEKIYPAVLRKLPQVSLHLAGRAMPQSWKMMAQQKPELRITVQENVPDAKDFMRQHHLMIVPLLSGSGMRIKIIEGLALGKCIVSTTIGAEGIEITPDHDICIADDPQLFADTIIRLLSHPNEAQRIAQAAHQTAVEKYDQQQIMLRLIAAYQQLLSS